MASRIRTRVAGLVAALGLAVTAGIWGMSSPVGSSADEGFHLASIWCAWGSHVDCRDFTETETTADFLVPTGLTIPTPCFTEDYLDSGRSSAKCALEPDEGFVVAYPNPDAGTYPPVYYNAMRAFVGPEVDRSVVIIRFANVLLAGSMLLWALLATKTTIRRSLALSWAVGLVPFGLFYIASVNPSGWAIIGVGTYWAFLLSWIKVRSIKEPRAWWLMGGTMISAIIAASARSDAALYLGVTTLAVAIIAFPNLRAHPRRIVIFVAPMPLFVWSFGYRLRSLGGLQEATAGSLTRPLNEAQVPVEYGVVGQLIRYAAETPAFLAGAFGVNMPSFNQAAAYFWGVGWFEVQQPSLVAVATLGSIGAVIWWGLASNTWGKLLAVVAVVSSLISVPLLALARFDFTNPYSPRYMVPLILVFLGLVTIRPWTTASRFSRSQMTVLIAAMTIAHSASLLATMRRYTNGQTDTWLSFNFTPEWWWSDLAHPSVFWATASIAFAAFLVALLSLTQPPDDQLRSKQPLRELSATAQ